MARPFNLTAPRRAILKRGVEHRDGVVRPAFHVGFDRVAERRNITDLECAGFLEPNVHGGWYVTDAGRAALASEKPIPSPRYCAICHKPGPGCFAFTESAIVARGGEPGNGYAHVKCFQRARVVA